MIKVYRLLFWITFFYSTICFSQEQHINCKEELILQNKQLTIDLNKSIKIGTQLIEKCKNDSIKALAYALRGTAYSNQGNYIKAFDDGFEAKKIFNLKTHNIRSIVYNNIFLSNIYKRIGLIDQSISELKEALNFINENDSKNYILISSILIAEANVLFSQEKHQEALPLLMEAEKNLNKITDSKLLEEKNKLIAIIYSDISNIYLAKNDFKQAEKYINQSISMVKNNKNFEIDYINTITLAEIYFNTNREKKTIKLLESLQDNSNIETAFRQFIYDLLSRSYLKIGDHINAKLQREKADAIKATFQEQKIDGIKEAFKHVNNELQKVEKEKSVFRTCLFGSSILSILIFIITIKKYRKKIKREKQTYLNLINSIENQNNNIVEEKKKEIEKEKKKEIEKEKEKEIEKEIKFTNSELELLEKLHIFEENKGFLKSSLTLAVLAVELNTNTHYLSEIINKAKNKNINTYINELRINYIVNELYNKPELLSYKISYIAELAGFNSHNSFSIVFKKITNISPSLFIEQRRKELKK